MAAGASKKRPPRWGGRHRGRARGSRGQPGLERLILLRQGVVPPDERLDLSRREAELLPMNEDGGDRGAREILCRRGDQGRRGRWWERGRRGTAQREETEKRRRAHATRRTPGVL